MVAYPNKRCFFSNNKKSTENQVRASTLSMWLLSAELQGALGWVPPEALRQGFMCKEFIWKLNPGGLDSMEVRQKKKPIQDALMSGLLLRATGVQSL